MISRPFSGVAVELLWRRIISVVDEASTTLVRTSFSSVIRDFHDYACALFDSRGRLLAQSTHSTPGLLGVLPFTIQNLLPNARFQALEEGDVLITNDPWLASGHLIDVTVATPVFRDGTLVAYLLCVVHHLNIGGRLATLMSRDVFEEGLKIPPLYLYRRGEPETPVLDMLRANVREPEKVLGDIQAQVAANETGRRNILKIMQEAKLEALDDLGDQVIGRSEAAIRRAISELPNGTFGHSMTLNRVAEFEQPVTMCVEVQVRDDSLHLDFAGTSPQIPRAVNVTLNFTRSYSVYPLRCILAPDIPNNEGTLRPVEIVAPEGSLLNASYPCATWGRTALAHFLPELIMRALQPAVPNKVIASSGATPLWYLNLSGRRQNGKTFYSVVTFHGGVGARAARDGLSCSSYPANVASMPVEVIESESPILFHRKMFATDSAGAGEFRGGLGQEVELAVTEHGIDPAQSVMLSVRGGRFDEPICGLAGGTNAPDPVVRIDGAEIELATQRELAPGARLKLYLPGGGGYGDPAKRAAESIRADIEAGLISPIAAREVYGHAPAGKHRMAGRPDTTVATHNEESK